MYDITLVYNKSNPFGIQRDVESIKRALGGTGCAFREADPLEPPASCDLAIHLEIPIYAWMPWATKNILVVNPEWYEADAWGPYLHRFTKVVYKDPEARAAAVAAGWVAEDQAVLLPWAAVAPAEPKAKKGGAVAPKGTASTGFVWFLGGSKNKRTAVPGIVSLWKEEYPPLRVYSVEPLGPADLSGVTVPSNVRFEVKDLDAETRTALGAFFRGHVCCSAAEGFGYTAAEAEWQGAFTLLSDLPVYRADYATSGPTTEGVHIIPKNATDLDEVMRTFESCDLEALRQKRRAAAEGRWTRFVAAWGELVGDLRRGAPKKAQLPPVLRQEDCPPISVVTLLYNRRKFFDLACHSMILSDYPKDKIEWIIVEDSDDPAEDASDRVMAVAAESAPLKMVYVPLRKKMSVAMKRNMGCKKATNDIILMMDDDDHYPATSFRRRVAWLTKGPWAGVKAVAATTIACYDLVKGISAVNMPPLNIPLGQRVSEATLTFYKSWWEERGFPAAVQVGEAEEIVAGRETDVLEIPPQQVIVAFSHGKNTSSRRVPSGDDVKPGCFWGFPKEFLVFIHGLAGVKVVEEK